MSCCSVPLHISLHRLCVGRIHDRRLHSNIYDSIKVYSFILCCEDWLKDIVLISDDLVEFGGREVEDGRVGSVPAGCVSTTISIILQKSDLLQFRHSPRSLLLVAAIEIACEDAL